MSNISQNDVAVFYDEFAKKQKKTGLNLRHYKSFHLIKKFGLKRHHTVLEVGCGIGTFTILLKNYLRSGSILATDISPTNINEAKNLLKHKKNVDFLVTDMTSFDVNKKFDFIVMLDVLEHIPIENHFNLFKTFRKHLNEDGTIYINIPHHIYLDYVRINQPERLQIIDQSLSTDLLIDSIYKNDLRIVNLISHSIFNLENDYQILVLKPNKAISKITPISKLPIILEKLKYRILSKF